MLKNIAAGVSLNDPSNPGLFVPPCLRPGELLGNELFEGDSPWQGPACIYKTFSDAIEYAF